MDRDGRESLLREPQMKKIREQGVEEREGVGQRQWLLRFNSLLFVICFFI